MHNSYQELAQRLLNNRIKKPQVIHLGDVLSVNSCEHALKIQTEMIKLRSDGVGAWKCLLPLGEDQIVVAPIFANTVQSGADCSLFADKGKVRIEPEIAFLLGTDLPARKALYSEIEIDNAVKSCHMALELMQDRFVNQSDVTFYEKLADCLVNQGVFIGPEIDKKSAYSAAKIAISVGQAGKQQSLSGKHPNQLPQKPLYWLINFMTQRGISFTAGLAVITGSYAGIVEVEFNQETDIEYVGLGNYQVTFVAK